MFAALLALLPALAHSPAWAVHIPDGDILQPAWLTGGFAVAALLAVLGAWNIHEDEIPQVALLTSAFFVASLIHVPVPGLPSSAHLLINGLLGVVLGRRVTLAIPVGLFLQAVLLQHGGLTTLGINSCVMTLPALLAWQLFAVLQRLPWVRQPWFRAGLVALSAMTWTLSLVYCVVLFTGNIEDLSVTFHGSVCCVSLVVGLLAAWGERRLENTAEFPVGLLVGEVAVLATVILHCLVLMWGGTSNWRSLVVLTLVPHLFIAVIEGVVLGFTVGFLVRVKPAMLGWTVPEKSQCSVDALP